MALVSVAARLGQDAACTTALARILGTSAPDVAQYVQGATLAAFWSAPHCWMVTGPDDPQSDLSTRLKAGLAQMASVTDQSGGWVRFDMQGDGLGALLERLCNLDMARMAQGARGARLSTIWGVSCCAMGAGSRCMAPDRARAACIMP